MRTLNYLNLSVATIITGVVAILLFTASILFNKESFFLLLNQDQGKFADFFFSTITRFGEALPWVVALALVLILKRDFIWLLVTCFVISTLFVQGLKNVLPEQPRPTKIISSSQHVHTVPGVELYKVHSFPSGHTATAFTVFFIACLAIPRRWIIAVGFVYASFVGFSRIYLAEHFPRDIAGGMLVAIATIYLGLLVCKKRVKTLDE